MKYELRDYQQEASDSAVRFFNTKNRRNGILVLPTGAGKSLVIADIASKLTGNVLVFQPSKEILEQNFAKLKSYGVDDCSIYSASFNSKEISRITFATIGSVISHSSDFNHFRYIIIDECFPEHQFISTEWGPKRIGHLYRMYQNGEVLPRVESYDEKNKRIVLKPILKVMSNGKKQTIKLHFNGSKRIEATPNHPFLTLNGWKNASELKNGDICLTSGQTRNDLQIPNTDQLDIIFGSILGDGSVDRRPMSNTYRFRFIHGEAQKEYLEWKASMFRSIVKRVENNGISQKVAYKFSSPVLPINDFKVTKEYAIDHLSPKSLAILFMDDGSLNRLGRYATICAVAESLSLTQRLCNKLKNTFGIDCCVSQAFSSLSHKPYSFIRIKKKGVETLSQIIAPYVHISMSYKVNTANKHRCGSYSWNTNYHHLRGIVFQKSEVGTEQTVYNMEVEDTHTYVLHGNHYDKHKKSITHGIIVHNCHTCNATGGMYRDFFDCAERKILGLTATPYRLNASRISLDENGRYDPEKEPTNKCILKFLTRTRPRIFHDVIYQVGIQTLLARGYLAKLNYYDLTILDQQRLKRNSTGMDFDDNCLQLEFEQLNFSDYLVSIIKRLQNPHSGQARKGILVFTKFLEESEELCKRIDGCEMISGSTSKKERERILREFKAGNIPVVANVGVLTTGFDYPELDTVVMARPTMSLAMWYQIVGRAIRPYPGKEGWIVDLCGNIKRFGKVENLYLVEPKPGEYMIRGNVNKQDKQITNIYF